MGYGTWTRHDFIDYSRRMNRSVGEDGRLRGDYSNQEMFLSRRLDPALDPRGVVRECCDSADHPATIPVILALDVTGSMGQAAVEVAKQLNVIMTKLYTVVPDVEFMIMGIGDFEYDACPLQVSQFEADIRIAEQLDKVYFEFGGGGNRFESYTAAWYFALNHTRLDAWKRGKKGILITMGDERLNPYIPVEGRRTGFQTVTGDYVQGPVETAGLYREVLQKYEIYHLDVDHGRRMDEEGVYASWSACMDGRHFRRVTLNSIANEISDIILEEAKKTEGEAAPDGERRLIGFQPRTVRVEVPGTVREPEPVKVAEPGTVREQEPVKAAEPVRVGEPARGMEPVREAQPVGAAEPAGPGKPVRTGRWRRIFESVWPTE